MWIGCTGLKNLDDINFINQCLSLKRIISHFLTYVLVAKINIRTNIIIGFIYI